MTHRPSITRRRLRRLRLAAAFAGLVVLPAGVASRAEGEQTCEVTIGAESVGPLGGLELRVDYALAGGEFAGSGEEVSCLGLAQGALQSASDDDAGQELVLGLVSATGVLTPGDLWRCTFDATSDAPLAEDFSVVVDDALDPLLVPIAASASVSGIDCTGDPVCGNGTVEAGEECDDGGPSLSCNGSCQLTRNSQRCLVRFEVAGEGTIGGIQFGVDYSAAGGRFDGEDVDVECSSPVDGTLVASRDGDDDQFLQLALVSAANLPLPVAVWDCVFTSEALALNTGSFEFLKVTAVDDEIQPVAVQLTASAHQCVYGPYCGDGDVDPEETCDDGNPDSTDACTTACLPAACGDGFVRSGVEDCDWASPAAGACCSTGCTFRSSASVCRAAAGVCDLAEHCSGSSADCPADAARTAVCRPSTGVCDIAEACSASSASCPADVFQLDGTACTSDGNVCTTDQCSAGVCAHPSNTEPCDDGNPSTTGDTCQDGVCVGGGPDPVCGDADGNGSVSAADALRVLHSAVGLPTACPLYRCDTDNNGNVQASDAQRVLRKAVGQDLIMSCPPPT